LIADSGSTATFATSNLPVINKRESKHPITIRNPNGTTMTSTHEAELDAPALPKTARHCYIVPALQEYSLVSIGQICDAGCEVTFTKDTVYVTHHNNTVLQGKRSDPNGLWHFDVPNKTQMKEHQAGAIDRPSAAHLVHFAHAALFSPTNRTLEKALKANLITGFPGLTLQTFRRHAPNSFNTAQGHMDQVRQNTRSTKNTKKQEATDQHDTEDQFPDSPEKNARTHNCFVSVEELTGQVFTDQTGKFPITSASGMKCIMILCDYDSDSILAQPLRN